MASHLLIYGGFIITDFHPWCDQNELSSEMYPRRSWLWHSSPASAASILKNYNKYFNYVLKQRLNIKHVCYILYSSFVQKRVIIWVGVTKIRVIRKTTVCSLKNFICKYCKVIWSGYCLWKIIFHTVLPFLIKLCTIFSQRRLNYSEHGSNEEKSSRDNS